MMSKYSGTNSYLRFSVVVFLTFFLCLIWTPQVARVDAQTCSTDLQIVEYHGPSPDVSLRALYVTTSPEDVYAVGEDLAYLGNGLSVLDYHPLGGSDEFIGEDVVVADGKVFVAGGTSGIGVFDAADFRQLKTFSVDNGDFAQSIAVHESTLAIAYGETGLVIVDIGNDGQGGIVLERREGLDFGDIGNAVAVSASDSWLYILGEDQLAAKLWKADLADLSHGLVQIPLEDVVTVNDIYVDEQGIYLATGSSGLVVYSLDGERIGAFQTSDDERVTDVHVDGSYGYLGLTNGVILVDLSNLAKPRRVDCYRTDAAEVTSAFGIASHVYVTEDNNGIKRIQFPGLDEPQCYALTLDHAGEGNDAVAEPESDPACPRSQYLEGTVISLTADPAEEWRVLSWSGTNDDLATGITNTLTMPNRAAKVTVTYIREQRSAYLPLISKPIDRIIPVVKNGGFESGANGDWQETVIGADVAPLIVANADVPEWSARNGQWLAWLGGFNDLPAQSEIVQEIDNLAPPVYSDVYLDFWYAVGSESTNCDTGDYAEVQIGEDVVPLIKLCRDTVREWTYGHYPIAEDAITQNPLQVVFRVVQDDRRNSNLFLDDIRICTTDSRFPDFLCDAP